jgi:phosphoribosylamine--glycine ligase
MLSILIVGAGGREHALAARLHKEGHAVACAPGNAGMASLGRCHDVAADDLPGIGALCARERFDLVVVGPERPLALGLVDALVGEGHVVFGPTQGAARIESSKAFAKSLMLEAGVPTAAATVVHRLTDGWEAITRLGGRCVVKQDGLAGGKGVRLCSGREEAIEAAMQGLSSGPVLIEERLEGEELSCIALSDGDRVLLLPPARDHKRLLDDDRGPNTGGMGAVCPVPMSEDECIFVRDRVLRPALRALADAGTPFRGALYAGLIRTEDGPRVLEFNARFGDPETQAMLAALPESLAFGELLLAAACGRLDGGSIDAAGHACSVTLAAEGYPDDVRTGDPIEGHDTVTDPNVRIFHGATRDLNGRLFTAGGRVLHVVAAGPSAASARNAAYIAADHIRFDGRQLRRDVGGRMSGASEG